MKIVALVTCDITVAPRSPAGRGHTPWVPAGPSPRREGGHPAAARAPHHHHRRVPAGLPGTAPMQETDQEPPGQLPALAVRWHRGRGAAGVGGGCSRSALVRWGRAGAWRWAGPVAVLWPTCTRMLPPSRLPVSASVLCPCSFSSQITR